MLELVESCHSVLPFSHQPVVAVTAMFSAFLLFLLLVASSTFLVTVRAWERRNRFTFKTALYLFFFFFFFFLTVLHNYSQSSTATFNLIDRTRSKLSLYLCLIDLRHAIVIIFSEMPKDIQLFYFLCLEELNRFFV